MKYNLIPIALAIVLIFHTAGFSYQLGPHPRILINKQQLPSLTERASGVSAREYSIIKGVADRAAAEGVKRIESRFQAPLELVCLGICYLVEGQLGRDSGRYADAVKQYWGNGDVLDLEGDGSFGYHGLVYDWIFDSLSPAERKLYGDRLGNWLRHYTGVAEITLKSGHWWYNQTWGPSHLNTPHARDAITSKLFISLALKGSGTIHESDAKRFLDSWSKRVPEECIPAFDEMGGVWSESMGHGTYGPIEVIAWAFEAWRTATGEDLFQLCAEESYPRAMTRWATHLTVPFNGHTACIDDNGGGIPRIFSRVAPLLASRYRDPVAAYISARGAGERWTEIPWTRFLFHDSSVQPSAPSRGNYPLAHHFRGAGHIYMRSEWDNPDATWSFFGAGPKLAGHSRDDEGHFLIARKGWLVMRGGGRGGNEDNLYAGGSLMFNLVTIYNPAEQFRRTDKRQRPNGPKVVNNENDGGLLRYVYSSNTRDDRAEIKAYYSDDNLTYAAADITQGYSAGKVKEVTRQYLYVRGEREFFVIFDRVEATDPAYPKTWFLHMPSEPEVSGQATVFVPGHVVSFKGNRSSWLSDPAGLGDVTSSGRSKAFLTTLLPEKPIIVKRGGEGHDFWGNPHEPSAQYNHTGAGSDRPPIVPWRLEVESGQKSAREYFLHILEIGDEGDDASSPVSLLRSDNHLGAEIETPGGLLKVMFTTTGPLKARIEPTGRAEIVIE
ncbi:MAG: hypothetical protein FVQ81_00980 [Candidatus Glassbacteria bacterium]|nr:hypothetical protein [Candidatus Glassbacteria bacterium]